LIPPGGIEVKLKNCPAHTGLLLEAFADIVLITTTVVADEVQPPELVTLTV
jgi:hypothetical protein